MEIVYYGKDYNEKEKEYIKRENSLVPNGYNLAEGGEEPPIHYGEESATSKLTEEEAKQIKKMLVSGVSVIDTQKVFPKVTVSTIRRINIGQYWKEEGLNYPLVEISEDIKLNEKTVEQIINDIKNTNLSLKKIGEKYGVCKSTVVNINNGHTEAARNFENSFPIRKSLNARRTSSELNKIVENIIEDLLNTNLSFTKIAEKYNIGIHTIGNINSGKTHHKDNINYPLRKNNKIIL